MIEDDFSVEFEKDVEFTSYFIGYFMGDGSIDSKGRVSIVSTDKHILEDMKLRMGYDKKLYSQDFNITKSTPCSSGLYKIIYMLKFNKKNSKRLLDLGLKRNKENNDLSSINYNIDFYHFLRGLMDSDGSITLIKRQCGLALSRVSFLARKNLAFQLHEIIESKSIKAVGKNKVAYVLNVNSTKGLRLLDKIYENSTIYLDRKYQKYVLLDEWRSHISKENKKNSKNKNICPECKMRTEIPSGPCQICVLYKFDIPKAVELRNLGYKYKDILVHMVKKRSKVEIANWISKIKRGIIGIDEKGNYFYVNRKGSRNA